MRPLLINYTACEGGDGVNNILMEKQRALDSVKGLWEEREIHCLILLSLFLQVFLFLTGGTRRRSSCCVLRSALWLAYLSADAVAVYVLGHLAVHASGPSHHLMFFWAPFVLVHLGGQDTITAFSKEDNELWRRHLLNLVLQAAVAAYVVAKVSWPDRRLRAAMVLIFLSGCIKYAERTRCLFFSSVGNITYGSVVSRWSILNLRAKGPTFLRPGEDFVPPTKPDARKAMNQILAAMTNDSSSRSVLPAWVHRSVIRNIMSVDAPRNEPWTKSVKEDLPDMVKDKFPSSAAGPSPYVFVGECLMHCYQNLYTKTPIRSRFYQLVADVVRFLKKNRILDIIVDESMVGTIFQYVATPITLVLFTTATKGDHASRADIAVSYILLVGAVVLDVSSVIMSFVPDSIQLPCCQKQWSENLAQYNIMTTKTCTLPCWGQASVFQMWCSAVMGIESFGVEHACLTEYIKKFILEKLVLCVTSNEWNIASFRGQLDLREWKMDDDTTSSSVDFPESVLIWHIATELCCHLQQGKASTSSPDEDMKKHRDISTQLSRYIMYLVFKCGALLSNHSRLVHISTDKEIQMTLSQIDLREEEAITKLEEAVTEFRRKEKTGTESYSVTLRACELARGLTSISDEAHRWDLIASVWSEMLYYTAPRCGGAFHYQHLATGGEFATHVLLLMSFLGPLLPEP